MNRKRKFDDVFFFAARSLGIFDVDFRTVKMISESNRKSADIWWILLLCKLLEFKWADLLMTMERCWLKQFRALAICTRFPDDVTWIKPLEFDANVLWMEWKWMIVKAWCCANVELLCGSVDGVCLGSLESTDWLSWIIKLFTVT